MAAFLVAFPGWLPVDYWGLTVREHRALTTAHNKAHK